MTLPAPTAPASRLQPELAFARILVVDDEPANLKLLSLILRTEGYASVETLQDPREVLASYQANPPDLILLDINMPHLDGFEVMAQLLALGEAAISPVVVLTAQTGEDFVLRALQGGAVDFLTKPFNRRELLARVKNVLLARMATRMLQDQNALLEQRVQQRTHELRLSRLDIVRRLGRAAEYRDNETGRHVLRMSYASALLAQHLGWDEPRCELMLNASPMHDVGKIGVPDMILLKPGPLTPAERVVMQTHTTIGSDMLSGSDDELLAMAAEIAHCHHEKWDGSGYPRGLAGTAIPESARIVAIADVFDALTSPRPYKDAWSVTEASEYLRMNAGSHFDPAMVKAFMTLLPEVLAIRELFADSQGDLEAKRAATVAAGIEAMTAD